LTRFPQCFAPNGRDDRSRGENGRNRRGENGNGKEREGKGRKDLHLVETFLGPWKKRARRNSEPWKKRIDREKARSRYAIAGLSEIFSCSLLSVSSLYCKTVCGSV
jgi:hypothetical protein